MKKILTLMILIASMSLFATLEIDIDFDTNVVSEPSSEAYTSEYFNITNVGETADYTFDIEMNDYPDGWFMTWCNLILPGTNVFEGCHHHSQPFTFSFPADATFTLDFQVNNMGGIPGTIDFEYIITGGDLTEALILPFTFSTEEVVVPINPLEIEIGFDTDVISEPSTDAYTSEYFEITNVGETAEYTIDIEMIDYPEGWFMTWCNLTLPGTDVFEGCHHHSQPFTFSFPADATFTLDFQVNGMGGDEEMITFEYVITGGDLTEALILPFTFSTLPVSNDNGVASVNDVMLTNYPNPFNPETTISYTLNKSSQVKVEIYNILGQHVSTLVNEGQTAGSHSVVWNGKDKNNNDLSSGIYFYKLTNGAQSKMNKMILMK